ncbi:hypothetical protein C8F04DRAFT_1277911 [Mycena alexandri]|uniref:CxC2-like cysteine cluster KDZ transposase-associated domain-containing protein n=1 Tax=Mycena alexandri TaxID=1745969 RepID=A0AAD6WL97_9AGAR|nr:hypothetical protein C8F04DRAFT_1277911 [Mycena alexandri]
MSDDYDSETSAQDPAPTERTVSSIYPTKMPPQGHCAGSVAFGHLLDSYPFLLVQQAISDAQKLLGDVLKKNKQLEADADRAAARKPRKGKGKASADAESGPTGPNSLAYLSVIMNLGKLFAILVYPWIDATVFSAKVAPPLMRVSELWKPSPMSTAYPQYLTAAIYQHVPEKYHSLVDASEFPDFTANFLRPANAQRSTSLNTIKNLIPTLLATLIAKMKNINDPFEWQALILFPGGLEGEEISKYPPILYPNLEKNQREFLKSSVLTQALCCILFGPASINGSTPGSAVVGKMWGVQNVTFGAMSLVSVFIVFHCYWRARLLRNPNEKVQKLEVEITEFWHNEVFVGIAVPSAPRPKKSAAIDEEAELEAAMGAIDLGPDNNTDLYGNDWYADKETQAVSLAGRPSQQLCQQDNAARGFPADNTLSRPEERYVATSNASAPMSPVPPRTPAVDPPPTPPFPFHETSTSTEEDALPTPAYESTPVYDEEGAEAPPTPSPLDEFKAEEPIFATLLLELHYSDQLDTLALCRQCWLDNHRNIPTHWAFVWNKDEQFFEKHDLCRVKADTFISLGHHEARCPIGPPARSFTLVDSNGVHATSIQYCGCRDAAPKFQQLLRAGIFPGSVKEPKMGFTLILLELFRQYRCQGKSSAYNFALVLQRMTDSFFGDSVPDIYDSLLLVSRFHQYLDILIRRGHAHDVDGISACNAQHINISVGSLHLIAHNMTLNGNFKANLFFKRDKGSETALTDGRMYFALESEYQKITKEHVVHKEDTDIPCNNHIGSIRHQGLIKSGKVARSGVVACACNHTVLGALIDLLVGEGFVFGTYALRELLWHMNSPPHEAKRQNPTTLSYDSLCSFIKNLLQRAMEVFPDKKWLHELLKVSEGQIPLTTSMGHFYGESAEAIWAFINALGASTRQMTGPGRHNLMNVVFDFWNTRKVYDQAQLLAAERVDALRLFELHMAVVEDLSRQHATDVPAWSRLSRKCTKDAKGGLQSVYQHKVNGVLGIETVVASMIADERVRDAEDAGLEARSSVAQWIRDGIFIDCSQTFVIPLLNSHKEHPLPETWTTIMSQREKLKIDLKNFRERQPHIYPRLTLSAMNEKEPELTALQLPSYCMKHGHEADNGVLAVQAASLALSAVMKAQEQDYRGQAGVTPSERNLRKANLMKNFKIAMYNRARQAIADDSSRYPLLTARDTRRKETHLHRARGDPQLFDGTAWYLQSGQRLTTGVAASVGATRTAGAENEAPVLLAGTQGSSEQSPRRDKHPRRLHDIAPNNVEVTAVEEESEAKDSDTEPSPSKQRRPRGKKGQQAKKKSNGWIWAWFEMVTTAAHGTDTTKLAQYKNESMHVQWFRAEAEMYCWLEQYERKHAEMLRVICRFRRDHEVWSGLADRKQQEGGGRNGAASFRRAQAAMYKRLEHNATTIFKDPDHGAHQEWVSVTSLDELAVKVERWRESVFHWMDELDIYRIYKDEDFVGPAADLSPGTYFEQRRTEVPRVEPESLMDA